jgi:protoheme IX farnesyltransferase
MGVSGYKAVDDKVWARKLFVFSIVTITALSVMMSVDFQATPSQMLMTSVNHICGADNVSGFCAAFASR